MVCGSAKRGQDVVDEVRILLVKAIQETADDDGE